MNDVDEDILDSIKHAMEKYKDLILDKYNDARESVTGTKVIENTFS